MELFSLEGVWDPPLAMDPEDLMADINALEVEDSSVKKTRKLASKKGSSHAGIDNDDDEPPPPHAVRRTGGGITFRQKLLAMTFFRCCDFCLNKDNDADPIEPACNRFWMYYVTVKLLVQTDGRCCYYCARVFAATAKNKFKTLTGYKDAIKEDNSGNLHEAHLRYMHWMIAKLTEQFETLGSRATLYKDRNLSWPKPWTLYRMEIVQLIWELPEENFKDEDEYFKEFSVMQQGDSLCRGPGGKRLVKLKREKLYRRKKRIIQQAVKQREEAGGEEDDIITQGTMGLQMKGLVDELEGKMGMSSGSTAASSSAVVEETKPKAKAKAKTEKRVEQKQTAEDDSGFHDLDVDDMDADVIGGFEEASPKKEDTRKDETPSKGTRAKVKAGAKRAQGLQSSPQGAAAGAAGAAAKKKGAPKKDSFILLQAGLRQFGSLTAQQNYVQFLGQEWKNMGRNWKAYIDALTDKIKAMEEAEEDDQAGVLAELVQVHKAAQAVRRFCSKWSASGPNSKVTLQTYDEQIAWCKQDPAIQSPFPEYVRQTMHGVKLNSVWPAVRFWPQLDNDMLGTFLSCDEVAAYQIKGTATKVNVLTQDAGAELSEITEKLEDLHKCFYSSNFNNAKLEEQMGIFGFYLGIGKLNEVKVVDGSNQAEITFHPLTVEDCEVAIKARDDETKDVIQAIGCCCCFFLVLIIMFLSLLLLLLLLLLIFVLLLLLLILLLLLTRLSRVGGLLLL